MLDERLEDQAMLIISNAGAARSKAFEALSHARKKDFGAANEALKESQEFAHLSHDAHSELLKMNAKGEVAQIDLLLTHAQDHLMCAALAQELINEIVALRREMEERS
ncbi:MAG: PTS lactose/cellobiose transporter subunit IIA [Lachnospiraceae bacterium]|nr:PTS lactose/cellobiose transporter subunit IIA [Lachnospiraceae bacterium]